MSDVTANSTNSAMSRTETTEIATFGGGCFWCTEAVFDEVVGVTDVVSGYTGGQLDNPSYDDICEGTTGHAEVIRVAFDPAVITYAEILEIFFATHDPNPVLDRVSRRLFQRHRQTDGL